MGCAVTMTPSAANWFGFLPAGILSHESNWNVVGWGLTFIPTPHRFRVNGHTFYTWCALDALTIPALLGMCQN